MPRPYAVVAAALTLCVGLPEFPASAQTAPAPMSSPTAPSGAVPTPIPQMQLPQVPEVAPGYSAPTVPAPPTELVGVTQTPFVALRLDDAVAMALSKNTDLAVAQENRTIASYQIVAAHGPYDVQFQVAPSYSHQVIPPVSVFQPGPNGGPITQDTFGVNGSISKTIEQTGTQVQVGASGQRITSNSTVNTFNPYYMSALSVNVSQPLLRGFASDENRRQLQLSRINAATSTDAILIAASNTISSVEDAYWDLVAAWRNVAIQEEGLRNALAQAQTTQRSATAGRTAPIDVTESNSQVALFQDNVLSALENVGRLQNQLKSLILDNPGDPIWTANLVPASAVGNLPSEPSLDDVVVAALRNRPEIAQLRDQRRSADVTLAYARDQLKPTVNLQLGYTTNGFAGFPANNLSQSPLFAALGAQAGALNQLIANANAGLPPSQQIPAIASLNFAPPPYTVGGFGTAMGSLFTNRYPLYSAQLNIAFPIGNDAAKGNFGVAQEQERSLEIQQVALIQRIKTEASNALQTLREAEARLNASRISRQSAEDVLASEQRRFAAGASTTFLVLQRQVELANARGRELQAQTDLNKAVVELERVNGTILARSGFDVDKLGTDMTK